MFKKLALFLGIGMVMASSAQATLRVQDVDYTASDGTVMQGFLAYDDVATTTPRPGIIIVHDWMGLRDFQKDKAQELAKLGYVAFAADIYGKGVRPASPDEAKALTTKYKEGNRATLRSHIRAAYDKLASLPEVNKQKIVVMGYCFGGTTALELARSGAPLAGTASFHGGLSNPAPQDANNIRGRVLVMHGADDPFVPPAEVNAFRDEMKKARVNMTFISYPGAVHGFSMPSAGDDPSKGMAYDEDAAADSWAEFLKFLKEVF